MTEATAKPAPKPVAKSPAVKSTPAAPAKKRPVPAAAKPKARPPKKGFFADEPVYVDVIANEKIEKDHHQRLLFVVFSQSIAIAFLTGLLIFATPFAQPIYHYYARDPAGNIGQLSALIMPNMTNQAVLSWSVTSVTEILTIGFGDFRTKLASQKPRFTDEGWKSFAEAFHKQRIGESLKENQLVQTTVPSNVAVILAQGINEFGVYQWKVQIPVIKTYATNNNVKQPKHGLITLTIVRVPVTDSPSGIAIKAWNESY